ncbi:hypothetical protein [Streptomyces lavendulae]|uniref:hypothetical protein n=1 Tax=Streptomyces lavendulae TaxID=1914 RepID=UPI0036E1178C
MTTSPRSAKPAPAPAGTSAPKVVAEGVLSSVRPDPHADDGRRPVAWLRVLAPPSFGAPVEAWSWCSCDGIKREAKGRSGVLKLVEAHNQHRDVCPLLTAPQEGRKAA